MKHSYQHHFVAGLLLMGVLSSTPAKAQNAIGSVVIGERLELQSQLLNETRTVLIGKPATYGNGEDRYPVLYLLDDDGHFHHTTGIVNFLSRNQRIPEVLVVAIPNTDRTRDLTPPSQVKEDIDRAPTHGGADTFLRFISDELMPWVEQNYRTRPYRILVGHLRTAA